jgi:hypothetical protein
MHHNSISCEGLTTQIVGRGDSELNELPKREGMKRQNIAVHFLNSKPTSGPVAERRQPPNWDGKTVPSESHTGTVYTRQKTAKTLVSELLITLIWRLKDQCMITVPDQVPYGEKPKDVSLGDLRRSAGILQGREWAFNIT